MKIGLLSNTYPPDTNGVARSVYQLAQELTEAGNEVYVAVRVIYAPNVLELPSIAFPASARSDIKIPALYYQKLKRFFKESGVELIHSHDTTFGGIAGARVARDLGVPCVHTYHTYIELYSYIKMPAYTYLVRQFSKNVCNRYDAVTTPSPKIQHYLAGIGVTAPLYTILNVAQLPRKATNAQRSALRKRYGIASSDVVFTSFGRVATEKNVITAINTLQPLLQQHQDWKLVISGAGPQLEELKRLVSSRKLQQNIIFTGEYGADEVGVIASIGDICIFTSKTDVQPHTIFEAMAAGLPVVAIDDRAVDYLLRDGTNGFKRPLEGLREACEQLAADAKLRKRLGARARKDAVALSRQPVIKEYIALYETLINAQKPAALV